MAEGELMTLFAKLPRRPRYINDAPRTVKELTEIVVRECRGNASLIWRGKRALEVQRTFRSIHGVGPGIANMAVLLIEKAFGERFDDLDRPQMDIKADVHTKRVLYRLGSARSQTEQDAVEAARSLNPSYPGELDGALWLIGRRWCHATAPQCYLCPISTRCMKVDV
jgi:endonuclease III